MRGSFHLGMTATLLLSFAQAPFQHTHGSDPHHEHAEGFNHTHWKDSSTEPSWKADDAGSDARMLDWLAGDGNAPVKFLIALPASMARVVSVIAVARIPHLTTRNHDPPCRLASDPRGPPA